MDIKKSASSFLPPILMDRIRILNYRMKNPQNKIGLTGNYKTWNDALQASSGYDAGNILEKTKDALLKVKSGDAIYERDSVLFNEIQYSWPLLAGLMWVAAQSEGRLNVLDFGGSLGSTYFQNRHFLNNLHEVRWNIIEQPEHVKIGKELFENEILRFYSSIKEYSEKNSPDVIVMSSVLQYLDKPYEVLDSLLALQSDCIIIDRTPFWEGEKDSIYVQHVPPTIYEASYPIWVLSKKAFIDYIHENDLKIIAEFEALDQLKGPVKFSYNGMIIISKKFF